MSFLVTLTLLLCFGVRASYPGNNEMFHRESVLDDDGWFFGGFTTLVPEYNDLRATDGWFFDELEEDDRMFGLPEDPWGLKGPVSPVHLIVTSVSNSSDSCKLSVTCNTFFFNISSTFTCDTQTCSQQGGEQREALGSTGVSLHVYLSDGSIICNHSNQVSWTKDVAEIRPFCPQNAGSKSLSEGISTCTVKTALFSVGLIVMVSAVVAVHVMEKQSRAKQMRFSQPVEI